jgi:hypothetical protein
MMIHNGSGQFESKEIEDFRKEVEAKVSGNLSKKQWGGHNTFIPIQGQKAKAIVPVFASYIFAQIFDKKAIATQFFGITGRIYWVNVAAVATYVCQWPVTSDKRWWHAWQVCKGLAFLLLQCEVATSLKVNHSWAQFGTCFLIDNENFTLCKKGCRGASMLNGGEHKKCCDVRKSFVKEGLYQVIPPGYGGYFFCPAGC